ncbi:MAG: aminopeptidase P family protein [Chitinispirillales bacterium]|jgi:Xaa-Pro aminopeptidase|nr:aminopeptidase P family protein [Chitinispirillales bacterium]
MASRIRAVRKIISERQCTHALVTDVADIFYISGFRSTGAALLVAPRQLDLFADFRYKAAAQEFCRGGKWRFTLIDGGGFGYLNKRVRPLSVVGIQSDAVTVDQYEELRKALPGVKLLPLSGDVADVAMRKLPSEIESMKAAARIGEKALKTLLPHIKRPVTEASLARTLDGICAELGSEKPAFDTIVLFGERSALPHGRPGERKLHDGDLVLIDFGCTVDGFCSDMTRTFVYGNASEEQRAVYNTVLRAQRCACLVAHAGMKCYELDAIARSSIADSGYGELFGHGTGHGVGLRVHERPRLAKGVETVLPENSVVTIEPGVYVPGLGGVRIEDMVVLQKGSATAITHSPRKLMELPL